MREGLQVLQCVTNDCNPYVCSDRRSSVTYIGLYQYPTTENLGPPPLHSSKVVGALCHWQQNFVHLLISPLRRFSPILKTNHQSLRLSKATKYYQVQPNTRNFHFVSKICAKLHKIRMVKIWSNDPCSIPGKAFTHRNGEAPPFHPNRTLQANFHRGPQKWSSERVQPWAVRVNL